MPEKIKTGPFKGLFKNHYKAIVADPPWKFKTFSAKGLGRSADMHYSTMNFDQIKAVPVADLAAKDCALFLWITDPMLFHGQDLMKAWGFKFKTVGFYWVKQNKDGTPFTGTGLWTRANPEQVLTNISVGVDDLNQCHLASKGHPKRVGKGVQRLIVSPRREHSRKPDELYERIEQLVDGPYLDLFSREERPNWTTWGDETGKFSKPDFDDLIGDDEEDLIG